MSINTGVANKRLDGQLISADMLGDALNIARKATNRENRGLQDSISSQWVGKFPTMQVSTVIHGNQP